MADMFEYLTWRGDIPFSAMGPNPVDGLIFTTLVYVNFSAVAPHTPYSRMPLDRAVMILLADNEVRKRIRVDRDLELLAAVAASERFKNVEIGFYRDILIPEEDTQFAAMTFFLNDGSAYTAFRGTDYTLVGWKEDFNMSFMDHIPAQRLAAEYLKDLASIFDGPIHVGGHSKGGNLAIYASAMAGDDIQDRILDVANYDGPGFMEHILSHPGYDRIVPKCRTYLPQSSFFGMLLEREEPHTIIKSHQIGLLQHEPYSWEIMGANFIPDTQNADSMFVSKTMKSWLASMTVEERNEFFDAVFGLLMTDNTASVWDMLKPQTVLSYIRSLRTNEPMRNLLTTELDKLIQSAKQVTGGKNNE